MLVIRNAKIYTCAGKIYEQADILIDGQKIAAIGENLDVPPQTKSIDADGLVAMPGIVDAHSHVGLFGDGSGQDANEMTANATPEVESYYGIDIGDKAFQRVCRAGITVSAIPPGSGNVIGGMVCAVKSYGDSLEKMCIKNPVALKMALGGNPKGVYGKRNQMPMTRMGVAEIIRENLIRAKEYLAKQQRGEAVEYHQGMENLCKVLRREIPMKVHCEQFDMLTILRIAEEFDVELTIEHAWGASDFYDDFAASKNLRGIIFGPIGVYLTPGECGKVDIDSLIELDRRGVCCSIMTDGPVMNPDLIVCQAGELIRFGMDQQKALQMLTINPAKILGLEDRIGSLEKGKDADVVLFRGEPAIDTAARVVCTIVNGEIAYQE